MSNTGPIDSAIYREDSRTSRICNSNRINFLSNECTVEGGVDLCKRDIRTEVTHSLMVLNHVVHLSFSEMSSQWLFETLFKILLKVVYVLNIVPMPDQQVNITYCLKTFIYFASYTFLLVTSVQYEYNFNYGLSKTEIFNICIAITSVILSYLILMLILYSYLRNSLWQCFYQKVGKFEYGQVNEILSFRNITLLLFFIFEVVGVLVMAHYIFIIYEQTHQSAYRTILAVSCPCISFCYQICQWTVMLLFIKNIREQVEKSEKHLDLKQLNVKMAKHLFLEARLLSVLFNRIFGYQLLATFGQWILFILEVGIQSDIILNPEKFNAHFESPISVFFVSLSGRIAATATEKLLNSCYQLQEEFDCKSHEYQQLQSFGSYISNNGIRFTAAEFFEIKRSTILSVIATSTTYFVALVQGWKVHPKDDITTYE
ncbi:hypothetical protein HUJ04_010838 [Dendroctonus ponderosae]|nr:hypothetical protein HUJ04_010838 [Dendroctonus ponderosae]